MLIAVGAVFVVIAVAITVCVDVARHKFFGHIDSSWYALHGKVLNHSINCQCVCVRVSIFSGSFY